VKVLEFNPRFWGSLLHSLWIGANFPDLGVRLARGEDPRLLFQPLAGLSEDPGVAPRRLLKTILRGRLTPPGLSPGGQTAWRLNHLDPLPWLCFRRQGRKRVSCCGGAESPRQAAVTTSDAAS
jgi:hypothetical protein